MNGVGWACRGVHRRDRRGEACLNPTFAPMYLLSANGTLRTILILLVAWQVLRLWMRVQQAKHAAHGPQRPGEPARPKGDVRIERIGEVHHAAPPPYAEDADFEVIKDKPAH